MLYTRRLYQMLAFEWKTNLWRKINITRVWSRSRDPFLKFWVPSYFTMGEARHFKFDMQIDIHKYLRMHDRLPPKGMCSRSRDLYLSGNNW